MKKIKIGKKVWILIIGTILTILFSYLSITIASDRWANLFSEFAGWTITMSIISLIIIWPYDMMKKRRKK